MTKEHIWGDWLVQHLKPPENKHGIIVHNVNRPGVPNTSETRIRAGAAMGARPKIVCKVCNNGWMSRLQDKAKPCLIPLLDGSKTLLGREAQHAIAAWTTMAAMTAEYLTYDPRLVAISQADRHRLMETGSPPDEWRVWLGYHAPPRSSQQWVHTSVPIYDTQDIANIEHPDRPQTNTQTTSVALGKVYLHAMSSAFPEHARDWHWRTVPRARALLLPIWPIRHDFIAWPIHGLTDADATNFSTAFFRWVDGIGRSNRF